MANWSLKVIVSQNAMNLRRQKGRSGGVGAAVAESRRLLTMIPGASLLLSVLPFLEISSPGDIAFVCWGQHFSSSSTCASALLALRVWSGTFIQQRKGAKKMWKVMSMTCAVSLYAIGKLKEPVCRLGFVCPHNHRHGRPWVDYLVNARSSQLLEHKFQQEVIYFKDVWRESIRTFSLEFAGSCMVQRGRLKTTSR